MKYDLIISDFDGTFRHRDTSIGLPTLSAVKEFIKRGGKFAICTGRMPASIRPILLAHGFKGLFVAYQGSYVGEVETGKSLHESGFTKKQALDILRVMTDMGLRIHVYDKDDCYVNYNDEQLKLYEDVCAIESKPENDLYAFVEKSDNKIFKILSMVKKEERNIVRDELRERLGETEYYISCSASTLVEVTAIQDTKGAAVEFLADYYGVNKEKILAFGDNQNDAPLLTSAGHGVAVSNSDPYLKSVASEVYSKSCDEDAVGEYIKEFIL